MDPQEGSKNMDKPISVQINEAKNKIVNTINELNLHPSILLPIMKDIYSEVQNIAIQTEQREMEEYNNSLKDDEPFDDSKEK